MNGILNGIRRRAKRAIMATQRTRRIAQPAQVLRKAKSASLRMTSALYPALYLREEGGKFGC
jgi:hypothetical protein